METDVYTYPSLHGFPEMHIPEDNIPTADRVALGKKLFFDKRLSRDETVSCGSCHSSSFAMADSLAVSPGVEGRFGKRNSISLVNVGYQPYFMREGGVPTLEMQVLAPVQDPDEMDFNLVNIVERLEDDQEYQDWAQRTYGRTLDIYTITRAIACYERALLSADSKYDTYLRLDNIDVLSAEEQAGMELFFSSKTNCSSCHSGINFTDNSFKNNGLYQDYEDPGKERLTLKPEDRALFKVPSLRNVALTAPYMHNGKFSSLEEVLLHYNSGGQGHENQSELVKPLGLSQEELGNLQSFLLSLSDHSIQDKALFSE